LYNKNSSSGPGENPDRRYSPQAPASAGGRSGEIPGPTVKVRMKEERQVLKDRKSKISDDLGSRSEILDRYSALKRTFGAFLFY